MSQLDIYMFKVNKNNPIAWYEICSKFTIETLEGRHCHISLLVLDVHIVNFVKVNVGLVYYSAMLSTSAAYSDFCQNSKIKLSPKLASKVMHLRYLKAFLTLQAPIPQNGQTHSSNSSASCRRIV